MIRMAAGCALFAALMSQVHAAEPEAGITVMGDQDAALGLVLMPWQDETPAALDRPPGLHDPAPAVGDAASLARMNQVYETSRAYRAERLQRNR